MTGMTEGVRDNDKHIALTMCLGLFEDLACITHLVPLAGIL